MKLKNGFVYISFFVQTPELGYKLYKMLETTFDDEPLVLKSKVNDNISLVLTKKNELYFNNRGHHRLSIAKILKLKEIPIKIVLAKSEQKLKEFYSLNK